MRGRFANGPCDSFKIGGRWSGYLQIYLRGDAYFQEAKKLVDSERKGGLTYKEIQEHAESLQQLWTDMGFQGENPLTRDQYKATGYPDDAMVVSKDLYETVLKEYEGVYEKEGAFWDLDRDPVSRAYIGNKWIVVVDYHY